MCNFGRGHYEKQFCEFSQNLGQWFRCRLKDILSEALAAHALLSRTIYAILKEGIMRNIHVKFYEIWTSGSGDVVLRYFFSGTLAAFCSAEQKYLCNFGKGHY